MPGKWYAESVRLSVADLVGGPSVPRETYLRVPHLMLSLGRRHLLVFPQAVMVRVGLQVH